jgi:hypothetical protein
MPKKTVIRHVPFRTFLENQDIEHHLLSSFWGAVPSQFGTARLAGESECRRAAHAIEAFVRAAEDDPRSVLLTKTLLVRIIHLLDERIWVEDAATQAGECDVSERNSLGPQPELPATRTLLALIDYLISLVEHFPSRVLRICAQDRSRWPCLVSLGDLRSNSDLGDTLKGLQLGEKPGAGRPQPNELNQICAIMIETIRHNQAVVAELRRAERADPASFHAAYTVELFPKWALECSDLKPLSADSWKEWFEARWAAVLDATEGRPEKDPRLKPLGVYRNKRKVVKYGRPQKGTIEANIRDGIKTSLKRAFPGAALYPAKVV